MQCIEIASFAEVHALTNREVDCPIVVMIPCRGTAIPLREAEARQANEMRVQGVELRKWNGSQGFQTWKPLCLRISPLKVTSQSLMMKISK